jgi:transposase
MSEDRQRRKRSAAEKLRIVLAGLDGGTQLAELCRREGIAPNQYYQWKKQLLGSASAVFESKTSVADERAAERAAAEVQRLKDVIAEITAENLELKKGRWV